MIESILDFYDIPAPDSIAPENRNVARLQPSHYVEMGRCYRIISNWDGVATVTMLLHPDDIIGLKYDVDFGIGWPSTGGNGEQEIADTLEQMFAEREVQQ